MGLLGFLFGGSTKKIREFADRGAVILDVRSKAEYEGGAIPGAKHIPIEAVAGKVAEIKKWDRPIITCCESGVRSARAAALLRSKGVRAINGGGWASLYKKL